MYEHGNMSVLVWMEDKPKDKGKAKIIENGHEEWQTVKKTVNLHSRPLQSRHWDASSPMPRQPSTSFEGLAMKGWLQAVKKHIPVCEDENAFAALGSFDSMQADAKPLLSQRLVHMDFFFVHIFSCLQQ